MTTIIDGVKRWLETTAKDAVKGAVASFCSITMGASIFGVQGLVDTSILQRGGVAALGAATAVVLVRANEWATKP